MPFSFPSSPSLNQQSVQNGRTYQWDGYVWNLVANISTHASTHASGGSDALTPASIGAVATSDARLVSENDQNILSSQIFG